METYNIKVVKGSESLRITPVVVYKDPSLNRLQTYFSAEFSPMNLEDINWTGGMFVVNHIRGVVPILRKLKVDKYPTLYKLIMSLYTAARRVWFSYLPMLAWVCQQVFMVFKRYYWKPRLILPVLRIRLHLLNFVWCKKVHSDLHVIAHEQLLIEDPDGLTEDVTLVPSQKLLAQWYEQYTNELKDSEREYEREQYKRIQEFKHSLDDAVEIMYIAELDT